MNMDPNKAILVVCIAVFLVIGINAAIYVSVSRKNSVGQIELLRRAARRAQNPWLKEDKDLQELGRLAAEIRELRKKEDGDDGDSK